MADITLHHTLPHPLSRIQSVWKAYRSWILKRQADEELRAAVERLAALSPHYLDDIGIAPIDTAGTDTTPQTPACRA
ncbi:hypothetical protein QKW60_11515 [Defluviimonas aestuarii]|uniref:hypothetical protein n=1 Tax=Albidovulum aestuarii TaxID=1130726 RepID=UPI002499C69C|nr:hypothetical protein [Defluviimonas aestuarii]MDI3337041.1 hypothetical protein [Defluviimonas aestuarii]